MYKYNEEEAALPLREAVFRTLRRKILMGELKPGERLMEVRLTKSLGVSRTPIREAIHLLEMEGLVVTVPRHGASVAKITEKDLQDVLEVRCALEELAVELACKRIDKIGILKLKKAEEEFVNATISDSIEEMAEKDVAFHNVIFRITGNKRLIQLVGNLAERTYRYRLEYLKNREVYKVLIKEHEEIIECLEKNRPDQAKDAIQRHITRQVQVVSKKILSEE